MSSYHSSGVMSTKTMADGSRLFFYEFCQLKEAKRYEDK
jgi:hypothetical protein